MENKIVKFDEWNIDKQKINNKKDSTIFINIREIWFVKMGKNIGFEEDGKDEFLRPVLVIKKVGSLFFTVALTSKGKNNNLFYHKLQKLELIEKNIKYKNSSYVILSQAKVMDKKRFTQHIGKISEIDYLEIKQKLKALLL